MKKLFIAAIAAVMSVAAMAQTPAFSLKVPENLKVAKVLKPGVNLRQEPNTTSAKLNDWMTFEKATTSYSLPVGAYVPVIEEKDGWLHIAVAGYNAMPQLVIAYPWIKASFCSITDLESFGGKFNPNRVEIKPMAFPAPYSGLIFTGNDGGMDDPADFNFGFIDHNILYCKPFVGTLGIMWDSSVAGDGLQFTKGNNGSSIRYNPDKVPQWINSDTGGTMLNFSKLSGAQAGKVVNFINGANNLTAIIFTAPGKTERTSWYFDWGKLPNLPYKTVTIPSK